MALFKSSINIAGAVNAFCTRQEFSSHYSSQIRINFPSTASRTIVIYLFATVTSPHFAGDTTISFCGITSSSMRLIHPLFEQPMICQLQNENGSKTVALPNVYHSYPQLPRRNIERISISVACFCGLFIFISKHLNKPFACLRLLLPKLLCLQHGSRFMLQGRQGDNFTLVALTWKTRLGSLQMQHSTFGNESCICRHCCRTAPSRTLPMGRQSSENALALSNPRAIFPSLFSQCSRQAMFGEIFSLSQLITKHQVCRNRLSCLASNCN